MTKAVKQVLDRFERLSDTEKRKAAAEIIRRVVPPISPPLTDQELILQAESLFLELDQRETKDGQSQARRGMAR